MHYAYYLSYMTKNPEYFKYPGFFGVLKYKIPRCSIFYYTVHNKNVKSRILCDSLST